MQLQSTLQQQVKSALKAFHSQNYDLAEQRFKAIEKEHPHLVILPIYLAQISLVRGNATTWITPLEGLLQTNPYLTDAYFVLAQCYQKDKQLLKASQLYHQALSYLSLSTLADKPQLDPQFNMAGSSEWNLEKATQTLWQTLALLAKANIPAFPTSGTLLGLEREGQLLQNDKDLDIGLDWLLMEQAISELRRHGWREVQGSYGLMNPRCMQSPNGIVVDLCGFATEEATGQTVSGLWIKEVPFEWNRITYYPKIELQPKSLPAGEVWYLKNAHDFLTALYGKDWQTPDPDFDTIICAKNLKDFSPLMQCYAYSRLYKHLEQNRPHKAQRLIQEILNHHPQDGLMNKLSDQLKNNDQNPTITSIRVLAMGCFDLLHVGHLNYLNFAKQQGDELIVGLASDNFCQESKGQRPYIDQKQRQALVNSLKMVDETHILPMPMANTIKAGEWMQQLGIQKVICGQEWQGSEKWQALQTSLAAKGVEVIYAPHTQGISSTLIKQQAIKP